MTGIMSRIRDKNLTVGGAPVEAALLTASQYCRRYQIGRTTFNRLVSTGRLQRINFGGETNRYPDAPPLQIAEATDA